MKAWHFLKDNGELQWPCGGVKKPAVGQKLTVDPDKLVLCESGLHASIRIIDALNYAPGATICRVVVGGRIIRGDDKLVASERTIISMADATETLHLFACWCAERAISRIANPDPRSIAAIDAKRKWLRGEISDDQLEEAARAARSAALSAARAAWIAESAARSAAWSAEDAAWSAAESAAWRAERHTAWSAEKTAQNRKLTRMINDLLRD